MPVDLHAIRVIAGMPLRHEILVPRAKDFGIGGTGRRPFPPDLRGADSERRVDHPAAGLAQRVFLDKTPPHIEQMRVTDPLLGGNQPFQPGIGPEAIQTPQQPWLAGRVVEDFSGGEAGKGLGKPDAQVGFFEDIEQARHRPAAEHFGFELKELRRLGLGLQRREMDAVFALETQFDLRIAWEALVEGSQGVAHRPLDLCDEGLRVFGQV